MKMETWLEAEERDETKSLGKSQQKLLAYVFLGAFHNAVILREDRVGISMDFIFPRKL